jgi:hypothetical protein
LITNDKPDSKTLIDKIKGKGYWKIVIRPKTYNINKFTSKQCKEILINSTVNLSGWSYPFISSINEIYNYSTYVEHMVDWHMHLEVLRMYTSGQYVHLLGLIEDWNDNIQIFSPIHGIIEPGDGLDMILTLNIMTGIYEFCTRYIKNNILDDVNILIELNNMKNRQIITTDFGRHIYPHESKQSIIPINRDTNYSELIVKKYEYAIDDTLKIFAGFNWDDLPRQVLETEQKKLLRKVF